MREKNRNSIASCIKLPQFTTMNVIDGQAGFIIYSSLIFYSLTIDNILNIIVLLILAGITVATLTGDNGLIGKAEEANNTAEKANIKEYLEVNILDSYTKWRINYDLLNNKLETINGLKYKNNSISNTNKITELPALVTVKDYYFQILEDGTVISIEKPYELNTITKNNYGDYIDLGLSVVNTLETTDDWRILYNDKNGHIYAILADYLPNNHVAVKASGLNAVNGKKYNVNSVTSSNDLITKLNSTTAWQSLIPEKLINKCQVTGATTGEIIMASYNEKYGTSFVYTKWPSLRTKPNDSSSPIDTLYMPHPGSSYDNCKGYWLASPFSNNYPDYVWFVASSGIFDDYPYNRTDYGVCPVVSLPSDMQATKTSSDERIIWKILQ